MISVIWSCTTKCLLTVTFRERLRAHAELFFVSARWKQLCETYGVQMSLLWEEPVRGRVQGWRLSELFFNYLSSSDESSWLSMCSSESSCCLSLWNMQCCSCLTSYAVLLFRLSEHAYAVLVFQFILFLCVNDYTSNGCIWSHHSTTIKCFT